MPKDTFFNLPADKRQRFVDAALDEFGRQPFDQASLTALTKRLGIAKGSIYQYFDDKVDLFTWLVGEAGRRKLARLDGLHAVDGDVFDRLRAAYGAGLVLVVAEPRWASVVLQLDQPTREPRLQALRQQARAAALGWLRQRLIEGQGEGVVRQDLDIEVASHLVHAALSEGLLAAFLDRAGLTLDQVLDDPEAWGRAAPLILPGVVDAAIQWLRGALG